MSISNNPSEKLLTEMSNSSIDNNDEDFQDDISASVLDPYQSTRLLGHGGAGTVDEVFRIGDTTRQCYARKQVFLRPPHRRQQMMEQLREEARTIRRLRHRHVITLIGTYTRAGVFGIVMSPVADTDLQQFISQLDDMERGKAKWEARERLIRWPGCLIRGLDYIHEMRVKHRDIKPSNILIKGDNVYFTDFGISRIIPEESTTGTNGTFGPMTRMYVAPEALRDGARRGRAVDMFALGCVFLEMVMVVWYKGIKIFHQHCKESTGSITYAENALTIAQWIWYIWGRWQAWLGNSPSVKADPWGQVPVLLELVFLMLDPNPDHRITSRQLVTLVSNPSLHYFDRVNALCCSGCRIPPGPEDNNLPLHSVFNERSHRYESRSSLLEAEAQVGPNWEAAKRKFLKHHMWW